MSAMTPGQMIAALRAASELGLIAGPCGGIDPPVMAAGKVLFPPHLQMMNNTTSMTTTAARYYMAPWFFTGRQVLAGALFRQAGVGDSGKKIKIALYNAGTSGIGTLAKSFGEYTLDASATTKQLASAYTPPRGWYWGELVCDGAANLIGMSGTRTSAVASGPVSGISGQFGGIIADASMAENVPEMWAGDYVAGTYANFPEATSLVPTGSLKSYRPDVFPAFGFYS